MGVRAGASSAVRYGSRHSGAGADGPGRPWCTLYTASRGRGGSQAPPPRAASRTAGEVPEKRRTGNTGAAARFEHANFQVVRVNGAGTNLNF